METQMFKLPLLNEIVKEFNDIGINIEIINDYIHFGLYTYEDSPDIIENLCKHIFGQNVKPFIYKNIVSIITGNDYDPIKTNLIIKVKGIGFNTSEPDSDIEHKEIFEDHLKRINQWFYRNNNFMNSFLNIQRKLENRGQLNSKFTIPFRPTLVLEYFRTMMIDAGFQDNFVGLKPTKEGTRSIIYNFYGNMLSLKYEHTNEFERLTILMDHIYYSENFIAFDNVGLFNTIENIKKIYLRITRKFKRRNTIEKYMVFCTKNKESKKSVL